MINNSDSCISKNGYVVNYDTQKRRKIDKATIAKIIELRNSGLSLRKIAKKVETHYSNVFYTLKHFGPSVSNERPSIEWLDRKQCDSMYNMTGSMFDYVKNKYPQYYKKVNYIAYIHIDYINKYKIGKLGYRKLYKVQADEERFIKMYEFRQELLEEAKDALKEYYRLESMLSR